ncbi:MAG: carboxypeptidase regulatory-like domain-containing protein [Ignavibacteriae bacterium]|nr:carboxypeptidase regulatory-like domain-containing protein [Ignavibacteriota bacterium]MCB9216753.1 carboxypeptidase regulatory-like domain-containing protein [Ignavibacteria bacterium]
MIQSVRIYGAGTLFAAIFSMLFLTSCGDDSTTDPIPNPTTGEIQGTVTEAITGDPVAGVTVVTDPPSQVVTTDAEGKFSISSALPNQYRVLASKVGYLPNSVDIQVIAGKVATADIMIRGDGKTDALEFDGTDDMVVVPDSPELDLSDSSFTLEFYALAHSFRTGGGDRWNSVLGHGPDNSELDFLLGFESAKPMFYVRSYGSGMVGKTLLETEKWYHIAAVQDVSTNKLFIYVNGVLDSESILKGTPVTTSADLFIGARESFGSGNGAHFFDGILYEVRLWNRARSASEIQETMKQPLLGNEANLVGYWPMSDGTGGEAADKTSSGNAGVLKGGGLWVEIDSPFQ